MNIQLEKLIAYEDKELIILNKPQGLATTPGNKENICDLLFNKMPNLKRVTGYKENEGGLLNRLDNDTGGLILFAKNSRAFKYYSKIMNIEKIEKIYTAVVDGIPQKKQGIINIAIAHHPKKKKKMVVVQDGVNYRSSPRNAVTRWKILQTKNKKSVLEITIKKGARHQIRVHLAFIGCPILGDKLYNKKDRNLYKYHLLYANGIKFIDINGNKKEIFVEVPFIKNQLK